MGGGVSLVRARRLGAWVPTKATTRERLLVMARWTSNIQVLTYGVRRFASTPIITHGFAFWTLPGRVEPSPQAGVTLYSVVVALFLAQLSFTVPAVPTVPSCPPVKVTCPTLIVPPAVVVAVHLFTQIAAPVGIVRKPSKLPRAMRAS